MTRLERIIGALGVEPRPPDVIDRLSAYGDRLRETAAPRGLIGRSTVANLDVVHLADSLAAVPLIESHIPGGSGRLVDVGSGAGLPGLPIAIALPDLAVVLLESSSRRQAFLGETIEVLGIANARVAHARAEDAGRDPRYRERYDLAVSRAVLPTSPALELCAPLVRIKRRRLRNRMPPRRRSALAPVRRSSTACRTCGRTASSPSTKRSPRRRPGTRGDQVCRRSARCSAYSSCRT